jgi:Holliday junction resolvasome RuvABC DNA-binding subunit
VIAAVAVVGCGGGDSTSASVSTSPPRTASSIGHKEYLAKADAICTRIASNISVDLGTAAKRMAGADGELTEADQVKLVESVTTPAVNEMISGLRHLGLPAGEEADAEAILDAFEASAKRLESDPAAALRVNPIDPAAAKARAFGLVSCSQI